MHPWFYREVGEEYVKSLPSKKVEEVAAVYYFLRSTGEKQFDRTKFIIEPPGNFPDIIYRGKKFEITEAPAQIKEVIGRLDSEEKVVLRQATGKWLDLGEMKVKAWESSYGIEESFQQFILEPIKNKHFRYGNGQSAPPALKDVILLIYSSNLPVVAWNEGVWSRFKKERSQYFRTIGFRAIYLLDQKQTLQVYP